MRPAMTGDRHGAWAHRQHTRLVAGIRGKDEHVPGRHHELRGLQLPGQRVLLRRSKVVPINTMLSTSSMTWTALSARGINSPCYLVCQL